MEAIAKFEKVSFEQFKKDFMDCQGWLFGNVDDLLKVCGDMVTTDDYSKRTKLFQRWLFNNGNISVCPEDYIKTIYDKIKLPQRATTGSAGYDFYVPNTIRMLMGCSLKIPTGIRCKINNGWVLQIYPRSGQGFKYGIHVANTVGIIDSDYYNSDNEGHIFVKLVNDSSLADDITLSQGTAFCQGLFMPFGVTVDDKVTVKRNGGFGSTNKQ